jgi:hypothetical protein
MLDAFIIEEIKRRERERIRQERERPFVELPVPNAPDEERPPRRSDNDEDKRPHRGVVVIDLAV